MAATNRTIPSARRPAPPAPAAPRGLAALVALLALPAAAALATPAAPVAAAGACPTGFAHLAVEDPNLRLADRNRDGRACGFIINWRDGRRLRVLADNTIGDPDIVPPGACTAPFRPVAIGDPEDFPAELRPYAAAIDVNGDGRACAARRRRSRGARAGAGG